ncbi:unnamed protein product [Bursaphelenchus xylophilus]|uniref:(pine wood nematode) hypothetical protein n=1 Tax=Bursaphelenchus xylophilus TaxID=6326 RepID=A0A1I7S5A1_BURXY|nr:unnamed protein product [Bursaphelenchus xylophilus]CAG9117855.1 unnamed protein product [Bursaphelenchus xylophilus]
MSSAYIEQAEKAVKLTEQLAEADLSTEWPNLDFESDGVKIYSRQPKEFPEAQEKMLFTIVHIDAPIEKVFKLVQIYGPYRQKWDDLLERQEVVETLSDDTYIVHSFVKKKLILSARDAVEVCQIKRRPDGVIIHAVQGVDYPDRPPQKNYVRTKQFISGTYLKPLDGDRTEFRHVLSADLNLPIPRLMASMVASFKPRLVSDTIGLLKKAAKTMKVE